MVFSSAAVAAFSLVSNHSDNNGTARSGLLRRTTHHLCWVENLKLCARVLKYLLVTSDTDCDYYFFSSMAT